MVTARQYEALKIGQRVIVKVRGVDTESVFLGIAGDYAIVATGTGPDGTALARITSVQNLVLPEPPKAIPGAIYTNIRTEQNRVGTHDGMLWLATFPPVVDFDESWKLIRGPGVNDGTE